MISVVIPVYNVAKYLNEYIESVLKQTCTDCEMISYMANFLHTQFGTKPLVHRAGRWTT